MMLFLPELMPAMRPDLVCTDTQTLSADTAVENWPGSR